MRCMMFGGSKLAELVLKQPRRHDWLTSIGSSVRLGTRLSDSDFVEPATTTTLRTQETLSSVFIRREGDLVEFSIRGRTSPDQEKIQQTLERVGGRLAQLLFLPPGWDSFEARRTTVEAAQGATELLIEILDSDIPQPAIVPGSDGSLQLEWHLPSGGIEINIESRHSGLVFFHDASVEWERELGAVRSSLPSLIRQLTLS